MNGLIHKPRSIRTRIAAGFLLLLAMVFIVLAISFNRVMTAYIRTQAERQLGEAEQHVTEDVLGPRLESRPYINPDDTQEFGGIMQLINNTVRRATFLTQVQALVIGPQNEMVYPIRGQTSNDALMIEDGDYEDKLALYEAITRHQMALDSEIHRLDDGDRTYYVLTLPLGNNQADDSNGELKAYRLALYLDMTDVSQLAGTLNSVLLIIIFVTALIAAAITLFMSSRITQPVRELSEFAEAIGRSDFTRRKLNAPDRELIELGDTMNRAAEQLERYDKEQKAFFQNVSHELRTPLMSIKGYAEGIQVGVFEDSAQAAGVIISETDHLARMVEELLYLSRMDNITNTDEMSSFDVRELLSSCGESLKGVAMHEGKHIEYDFAEEPVMVMGSEKMLVRAFSNILTNGLRYAAGTVIVRCSVWQDLAVIRVEDDGQGIDEAELPHIFDRFFKGKSGKHGIGLSIAKAVVQQHHGGIYAENTGHGAAFVVELPIDHSEA